MTTGEILKETRKEKGITQIQLAKLAKVNVNTIRRIEADDGSPALSTLKKLGEVFRVPPEYFFPERHDSFRKVPSMTMGQILREIRKRNGFTQIELAEKAGVSANTIRRTERDEGIPEYSTLIKLGEVFRVPPEYFLPERHDSFQKGTSASTNVQMDEEERLLYYFRELDPAVRVQVLQSVKFLTLGDQIKHFEHVAEFSERLQEYMNIYHLKQVDILERCESYETEECHITKHQLSEYVSGHYAPGRERLELLAKALGVSEVWLLGYDVPM